MQLFEDFVKCKDCMNNIDNKCILYPGKDVKEENTGCHVGIDRNNKQKILGGVIVKTADELFEELGYEKLEDKYNIDYNKIYSFTNGDKIKERIRFCKLDKYIHIENYNFDDGITFGKFLDTKELQAINKKVEELGWI